MWKLNNINLIFCTLYILNHLIEDKQNKAFMNLNIVFFFFVSLRIHFTHSVINVK